MKWAKAQLGKHIQPCGTNGCKYNANLTENTSCSTPRPSPDKEDLRKGNLEDGHPLWNFYCMRFARTAYGAPAEYEKAENMYQALKRRGMINTSQDIPVGALIFWNWSTYGHIGIYSGNGRVIHTGVNPKLKQKGIRESPLTDITEVLDGYNRLGKGTSYLGWAHAPENWLL